MSTSPETSPNPSPSSRLPALVGVVVGLLAFGLYLKLVWPALRGAKDRAQRVAATLPLVEEAKRRALTYQTARAGAPVVWCFDHLSSSTTYVDGRGSEPIEWANEKDVPLTHGPTSGGGCEDFVATVVERRGNTLVLEYKGRP